MSRTILDGAWEVVDEWATTQEPRTEIFSLSFFGGHDYSIDFQEGWAIAFTDKKLHVGDEVVGRRKWYDTLKNVHIKGDADEYIFDCIYVEFNRTSRAGHPVFKVVEINPSPKIRDKAIKRWTSGRMYKFMGDGVMEHELDWYVSVQQSNKVVELMIGDIVNVFGDIMVEDCEKCRYGMGSYHCLGCNENESEIEDLKSFCPYCNSNYGDERCNNCVWYSE